MSEERPFDMKTARALADSYSQAREDSASKVHDLALAYDGALDEIERLSTEWREAFDLGIKHQRRAEAAERERNELRTAVHTAYSDLTVDDDLAGARMILKAALGEKP